MASYLAGLNGVQGDQVVGSDTEPTNNTYLMKKDTDIGYNNVYFNHQEEVGHIHVNQHDIPRVEAYINRMADMFKKLGELERKQVI